MTDGKTNLPLLPTRSADDRSTNLRANLTQLAGPATRICAFISALVFLLNAGLISRSYRWFQPGFTFGFEAGSIAKWIALTGTYQSPLGEQTGLSSWLSPAYPAFLGAVFKIFGVYSPKAAIAILLVQAMLAAASCFLIGAITWEVTKDKTTSCISCLLYFISPVAIYLTDLRIWDTVSTGFLTVLCIYSLIRLGKTFSFGWAAAAGLSAGALALTNASSVTFFPFALLFLLLLHRAALPVRIARVVTAGLLSLCVVTPWVVRNHQVSGSYSLRCCSGIEMYLGNNAVVWEKGRTQYLPTMHPGANRVEFLEYKRLTEPAYDKLCMQRAETFIRANYRRFVLMCARRTRDFWFGPFEEESAEDGLLPQLLYVAGTLFIPLISILGAFGLAKALKRYRSESGVLIIFLLIFPIPMYLASVNMRLQYPAQLVMTIFAAIPLAALVCKARKVRQSRFDPSLPRLRRSVFSTELPALSK